MTSAPTAPPRRGRPAAATRIGAVAVRVAPVICFGLLGAAALLPPVQRRRRQRRTRCTVCQRHQSVGRVLVIAAAVLLCAAAGLRAVSAAAPPVLCHSRIDASGRSTPEPLLQLATAGSPMWNTARGVLVSPASGIALAGSRLGGLRECAGPPLLVTFRWPGSAAGGSMVGDVFVTWSARPDRPSSVLQEGFVAAGSAPSTRFGPNIGTERAAEERLGAHEVRHLDQWAVLTAVGGPAAFPAAYFADYLLFPDGRSHFERAAGLADGDYPPPTDLGPAPLWGPLSAVLVVLLLLSASRVRLLSRLVRRRRGQRIDAEPGRCLRHTRHHALVERSRPAGVSRGA